MPGPQTQHKGTVYGDDENAPETYLLTYLVKKMRLVHPVGSPALAALITFQIRDYPTYSTGLLTSFVIHTSTSRIVFFAKIQ